MTRKNSLFEEHNLYLEGSYVRPTGNVHIINLEYLETGAQEELMKDSNLPQLPADGGEDGWKDIVCL